jgi:hypothetical protein
MGPTPARAFVFFSLLFLFTTGVFAQEGGYLSSLSIAKGENLRFYVSTSSSTFDIDIYRLGKERDRIYTIKDVKGGILPLPDSVFVKGCGWNPCAELVIPTDWKPGIYEARFPTSQGEKFMIFSVREQTPGTYAKTVVCLSANTWQAYNNWGGESLYGFNSISKYGAWKVTFDRPFSDTTASYYYRWTDKLVRWLEEEGIDAEFCTNLDLDRDPFFLDHYDTYVTVGHDEYWSRPERNEIQHFQDRGGRMIVLSGNTCWWQVRLEDSLKTLVCYRSHLIDPLFHQQDSLLTVVWGRYPLNEPAAPLLGVTFESGGYTTDGPIYPKSEGYGGYTVFRSDHWLYEGTGVCDGDIIGFDESLVGYEVDGAEFWWYGGTPFASGNDFAPKTLYILGMSPASNTAKLQGGHAVMGYFTKPNGGAVFNAGVTNWTDGLDNDPIIRQVTKNLFRRFTNPKGLPPAIVSYYPSRVTFDSINHEHIFINHRAEEIKTDSETVFFVYAVDPLRKTLYYQWKIGDDVVSTDTFFVLSAAMKKEHPNGVGIEVRVSNGDEIVTMNWALVDATIRIVSRPPSRPFKPSSEFFYQLSAGSLAGDHLAYSLVIAPAWLELSTKGLLTGTVSSFEGSYPVTVKVQDERGNSDLQSFEILVGDSVAGVHPYSFHDLDLTNAPNPFSASTKIAFELQEPEHVTIDVTDMTGAYIHTLVHDETFESGHHSLEWDGTMSNGVRAAAGIYYCRLVARNSSGKEEYVLKKIALL